MVRRIVSHVLVQAGYEVVEAGDGLRAVELALARKPALAILDIELPELNGIEALRRMRANGALTAMPAIMLTGFGDQPHVVQAADAGATEYIVKSELKIKHLLSMVQGILAEAAA